MSRPCLRKFGSYLRILLEFTLKRGCCKPHFQSKYLNAFFWFKWDKSIVYPSVSTFDCILTVFWPNTFKKFRKLQVRTCFPLHNTYFFQIHIDQSEGLFWRFTRTFKISVHCYSLCWPLGMQFKNVLEVHVSEKHYRKHWYGLTFWGGTTFAITQKMGVRK